MIRLAVDHNFRESILRGLQRRLPDLNVCKLRDLQREEADDPKVLAWAAREGRVLLTQDRRMLPDFTYDRVRRGDRMPGVFLVSDQISIERHRRPLPAHPVLPQR